MPGQRATGHTDYLSRRVPLPGKPDPALASKLSLEYHLSAMLALWKFDLDIELDKCIMYLSLDGEKRAVPSIAHLRDARDAEEKPFTRTQQENAKWIQTKY